MLALQYRMLLRHVPSDTETAMPEPMASAKRMDGGVAALKSLLEEECRDEAQYQELLAQHGWMLGYYREVERHTQLDDANIPDFTAIRCLDGERDIIETKQPFLDLFRKDGKLSAGFNDFWNQAERYLSFVLKQRHYLEDRGMRFSHPQCMLVAGRALTDAQMAVITAKLERTAGMRFLSYDQLLRQAEHWLGQVWSASTSLG